MSDDMSARMCICRIATSDIGYVGSDRIDMSGIDMSDRIGFVGWLICRIYRIDSKEGSCRVGYVAALLTPPSEGSCHLIHWLRRSTRRAVKGSWGNGVWAFSELVDHMVRLPGFVLLLLRYRPDTGWTGEPR